MSWREAASSGEARTVGTSRLAPWYRETSGFVDSFLVRDHHGPFVRLPNYTPLSRVLDWKITAGFWTEEVLDEEEGVEAESV